MTRTLLTWAGALVIGAAAGFGGAALNPAHTGTRGPHGPPGPVVKLPRIGVCVEMSYLGDVTAISGPQFLDGVVTCDSGQFVSVKPAAVGG